MIAMDATTNRLTIVYPPTVEHRAAAALGDDLPVRYRVIRDQLAQLHNQASRAMIDALALAQPQNAHLAAQGRDADYLAQTAATLTGVADGLYQSSVGLQHAAHLAGYDTSSLAPLSREIAQLNQEVREGYAKFSQLWRDR